MSGDGSMMIQAMQGSISTSLSPGNQVDDLPGVAVRKLFEPAKGKSGDHEKIFLGRNFDSLEMFLIMTCLGIHEKIEDI